eukprot:15113757-Alexandrium_andersonii.AAC.1
MGEPKGPKRLSAEATSKITPGHEAIVLEIAKRAEAGLARAEEEATKRKEEILQNWPIRSAD